MRLLLLSLLAATQLAGCGYNTFQTQDEQIKAAWSEVVNQYQRRADLIPNLVETVKGFAQQERDVLIGVTEARSKVGGIQATPELVNDPQAFQQFQAAQGELSERCRGSWWSWSVTPSSSPTRISAICRRSSRAPRTGSPSRATATSRRCRSYNVTVRRFPSNLTAMVFGYDAKPNFTVANEAEIARPPPVSFDRPQ